MVGSSDDGDELAPRVGSDEILAELGEPRSDDGFVYFRMVGERFEGPGMPSESLIQLQRYSELIYKVARLKWVEENPGKVQALPVKRAFDLRLVSIEEGSAQPVLRLYSPHMDDDDDGVPFILNARDIVNEAIREISVEGQLPRSFPRQARDHLTRFTKTVKPGESVQLAAPRGRGTSAVPTEPAILDESTLTRLNRIEREPDRFEEYVRMEGVITEYDGAKGTFELEDLQGQVHVCTLGVHEFATGRLVLDVVAPDGVTAPDVRVGGVGMRDTKGIVGDLSQVDEVVIIRTAAEKALMKKLELLKGLQPDWWGPGTRPPGAVALRRVEQLIPTLALVDVHIAMGANGDGAVVLEWWRDESLFSAEIEADGDMYLFVDRRIEGRQQDHEGPYDEAFLIRFVQTGVLDD